MGSREKISVAIITYNQQDTIAQTLDSVLCQQGDFDLEVVIGEDCSTDHTFEVCQGYAQRYSDKVIVLHEAYNLGILANFARTVRACSGDYLAILAGDDYWCDDHKLEKQLKYMLENPQFGVCCTSGYRLMVKTGRMVDGIEPLHPKLDGDISKYYEEHLSGIYAQPLSLLIRRDLLQYVDFDEYIRRRFPMEDFPMQSVLAHHTLFGYLPDKTCVYRISTRSATFVSYENDKYMAFHEGLADIRRYLHGLFPEDVPFTEQWAAEYVQHKEFLKYVWFGQYRQAKELSKRIDRSSPQGRKIGKITANWLIFFGFVLYKRIGRHRDYKHRAN